jgi:methyltransferase (TIGR00027 family)
MEQGRASRTALGAALHRAAHQLSDGPLVFADPLALTILGAGAEAALGERGGSGSRLLRLFIATRSRFSEDTLAEAYGLGVRQYVLLGAGLDTFAYRAAGGLPGLRVFEVDHPATQAWKRARLAQAAIAEPSALTFAPIDFERETLNAALGRASFDFTKPAVFAWLGVVPYLTRDAIFATLAFVATLAPGTIVIFDYGEPASSRGLMQRVAFAAFSARVAAAGEPFKSFFLPDGLTRDILALGFSKAEDFDAAALNARYFAGRSDGLALKGAGHLMRAEV